MRRFIVLVVAAMAMTFSSACGGGSDSGDEVANGPAATTTTAQARGSSGSDEEVPAFMTDFDRVCTTQVGFPGVTAYEDGPGLHPVVLFEDHRGEGFVQSSRTLPAGWSIEQDADYEDNSDLEPTQLIACSDRTTETPTGVKCEFESDGKKVELELVDADYELTVYAATTGEVKHQQTLEARNTECPYVAAFKKGDTTFVNQPSDDDYIAALKPVVAP